MLILLQICLQKACDIFCLEVTKKQQTKSKIETLDLTDFWKNP